MQSAVPDNVPVRQAPAGKVKMMAVAAPGPMAHRLMGHLLSHGARRGLRRSGEVCLFVWTNGLASLSH